MLNMIETERYTWNSEKVSFRKDQIGLTLKFYFFPLKGSYFTDLEFILEEEYDLTSGSECLLHVRG